ncbi:hypothetical protein BUALT_Bualt08G0080900 [Buddleja alternifolia]|uniref:DUF4005 domain-containing protein n=1 Tax=Buddleja alternifolia TaxID=168488 RepID=A0AAV6X637_9LAMI|nr:hypothetical protein BUALT_Bualt08G0080900 [Buddleja alternifolia]
MVKSTASCFKIISCGGDSVDHGDLETPESKGSSDRRRWSFRKRSARHRVLSNTVISEAPSSVNKESPESTAVNSQLQPDLTVLEKTVPEKTVPEKTVSEKTSVVQWTEEKTELSAQQGSKLSDIIAPREEESKPDAILDESSIIVIQAAIRGLLAQSVLLKQKSVIKLQAAVRGHLVRRHAVGTLRCVQAIVKMQALVRARYAHLHVEGSSDFTKQSERSEKGNLDPTLLNKKEAKPNGTYTYISIEKLLSNRFARQLMESTPKTKPINIKCDPLKSDSAWQWLERWMAASDVTNEEPRESGSVVEQHEKEDQGDSNGKDVLDPSDCHPESTDFKPGVDTSVEASENNDTLITYDANNLDLHASKSISPSSSHSELQNIDQSDLSCDVTESAPINLKETDLIQEVESKSLPQKEEIGNEQDEPDSNKFSTEQPETETKKIFSRKASNPAFIAAQSKFEELTSSATSSKLTPSSSNDLEVESTLDKVSSSADKLSRDIGLADKSVSNASAVQIGGSECGTELSITSTLDSPDRSEAEVNNFTQEPKITDETEYSRSKENLEIEGNDKSIILESEPSSTDNTKKLERFYSAIGESMDSMTAADSPLQEKEPKADPSDLHVEHVEVGSEASRQVYKSSPEASPRSHITVPESSQATPSSQVSVKPKRSRGEKSESIGKNKSSSADKKSLSNRNQDSRSSMEKEQKSGKRRNSFGSAKPDHKEQEPRDSSSSNSLPSYMQATQSARAKAIANGSPRSSPDVHDKEVFIQKRHSLPGANERQGSPRIQRSLSQAQQNVKGNGNHSPQDKKWRR